MTAAAESLVLDPARLSEGQLGSWRSLAARAAEPNPFYEPEFVLPALGARIDDSARLLAAADGERWLGAMPVRAARRWHFVPLPALVSWTHLYGFLGTPLLDSADPAAAARGLLSAAAEHGHGAFLGIDLLGGGGVAAAALRAAAEDLGSAASLYGRAERAALRHGEAAGRDAISSKHRRNIERSARRLSEHLGAPIGLVERGADPAAIDDFLRLEASGWKGEAGTAFEAMGHDRFFREVCRSFAAAGRLSILSLQSDDVAVAMQVGFHAGDEFYSFKIAYDDAFARFSPGIQMELANADQYAKMPNCRMMDSCALPDNAMINRMWTGRRMIESVGFPLPGLGGRIAPLAIRSGALIANTIRRSR